MSKGFTLLEVVVALMIFSISLLAITRALGQSARALDHAQEKSLAHWVARNATNELLLGSDGKFLSRGQRDGTMVMGNNTYHWKATVETFPDDHFVWVIHVSVSGENKNREKASLTTFTRALRLES
jgi:general secretion pathway protein I